MDIDVEPACIFEEIFSKRIAHKKWWWINELSLDQIE